MSQRLHVGSALPTRTYQVTRGDLVRYAGASGDLNPIHWSDRIASDVGLPGVIAHGMLTMAFAGQAITDWLGDPAAVEEYGVRFSRPVVVPDDDTGTEVTVDGVVKKDLDDGRLQVDLTVRSGGVKVLGQARAIVRTG
ncbi:MAG TPA: MaoC family dehydratase [Micromonosporaceae bacterium]|jgi:acyl dehydratase|nr:MaoC family dehydratase [Micromonosporaceae bacterium]